MAREFWYRLQQAPQCRCDGGGGINHDIFSAYSDDGGSTKIIMPGYHKTCVLLAADVKTVMDMPDSTGPEKSAKNTAFKNIIAAALDNHPYVIPLKLWDEQTLLAYTEANDNATTQSMRVNDYITVTLELSYPVDFQLSL